MSKVFLSIGLSLDGFMAPEGMDLTHALRYAVTRAS
jgi:hypothetical protein